MNEFGLDVRNYLTESRSVNFKLLVHLKKFDQHSSRNIGKWIALGSLLVSIVKRSRTSNSINYKFLNNGTFRTVPLI